MVNKVYSIQEPTHNGLALVDAISLQTFLSHAQADGMQLDYSRNIPLEFQEDKLNQVLRIGPEALNKQYQSPSSGEEQKLSDDLKELLVSVDSDIIKAISRNQLQARGIDQNIGETFLDGKDAIKIQKYHNRALFQDIAFNGKESVTITDVSLQFVSAWMSPPNTDDKTMADVSFLEERSYTYAWLPVAEQITKYKKELPPLSIPASDQHDLPIGHEITRNRRGNVNKVTQAYTKYLSDLQEYTESGDLTTYLSNLQNYIKANKKAEAFSSITQDFTQFSFPGDLEDGKEYSIDNQDIEDEPYIFIYTGGKWIPQFFIDHNNKVKPASFRLHDGELQTVATTDHTSTVQMVCDEEHTRTILNGQLNLSGENDLPPLTDNVSSFHLHIEFIRLSLEKIRKGQHTPEYKQKIAKQLFDKYFTAIENGSYYQSREAPEKFLGLRQQLEEGKWEDLQPLKDEFLKILEIDEMFTDPQLQQSTNGDESKEDIDADSDLILIAPLKDIQACKHGTIETIVELTGYLEKLEMEKYIGSAKIANLYNKNLPPGIKKLVIDEKNNLQDLIIDQRIGTLNRLLSHTISTLHFIAQENKDNKAEKRNKILDVLIERATEIMSIKECNDEQVIIDLQEHLVEGHKKLAEIADISQKDLLQVDDISTFIRPVVENEHKNNEVTIKQRYEPISHMSHKQKDIWRDIVAHKKYPTWWTTLTKHHQERYKQYAKDAMVFETLCASEEGKKNIKQVLRSDEIHQLPWNIITLWPLSTLSPERQYTIKKQIKEAKKDGKLEEYLTQLLDGDPWFMLAMPKSSGNRYTPLASNHVKVKTTTTVANNTTFSNTTHVRSNEVIIQSDVFKDLPFDYSLIDAPGLKDSSVFARFVNVILLIVLLPLRVVAIMWDGKTLIEDATKGSFSSRYATVLLMNSLTMQQDRRADLVTTTQETIEQVYDEFIKGKSVEQYDEQYDMFLQHHGFTLKEKHTIKGEKDFTPILHSASLLSPLPDWIENSVDIGARFFKADNNKKMLLYKLAAVEKINQENAFVGNAKIRAINFAANDYRRLAISGYGNRIHQHNSHVSVELLKDVLANTLVTIIHIREETKKTQPKVAETETAKMNSCGINVKEIISMLEGCKQGDIYDLNRLTNAQVKELEQKINSIIDEIKGSAAPEQAKNNIALTLQAIKAYTALYKESTGLLPENEQILLTSYANMMVKGVCGEASRVETHCKSGRDRTFVVQIYEQAMQAYFTQYGKLPLPGDPAGERPNFVAIYKTLFMQGLAQENSNQNQHGSFGLNNILIQRDRPLCFLCGTPDPKNTALLPADILDAILKENPAIVAQNEGQRYNGKHIKKRSDYGFLRWIESKKQPASVQDGKSAVPSSKFQRADRRSGANKSPNTAQRKTPTPHS